MARPSLVFKEVHLVGMPGFNPRERFAVKGLTHGVTVIHGPNGIGKSTLARAMQLLMWSDLPAGRGVHLDATLEVDGVPQERKRVQDHLTAQASDGSPVPDPAPWTGKELQSRYCIGIQDLLQKERKDEHPHEDFAKVIRTHTQGVDLEQISTGLEALDQLPSRANAELTAFLAARDKVAELARVQEANRDLEQDLEADLKALKARPDDQQELEEKLRALGLAGELLELEEPLEAFRGEEARLGALGFHCGGDFERLLKERDEAQGRVEATWAFMAAREADLAALKLGAPAQDLDAKEARRLEAALPEAQARKEQAAGQVLQARAARAAWVESSAWLAGQEEALPTVTQAMLDEAGRIATALEDARATESAWRAVAGVLGKQLAGLRPAPAGERIQQLLGWLAADARVQARKDALEAQGAAPAVPGAVGGLLAAAAALAALIAIGQLTLASGPLRLGTTLSAALAALALGSAWFLLGATRPVPVKDSDGAQVIRRKLEEDLAAKGLDLAWTESNVRARMEELRQQERAGENVAILQARLAEAEKEAAAAGAQLRYLLGEPARTMPGLDAGLALLEHKGYLNLVVAQVRTLQAHRAALCQAEAEVAGCDERLQALEDEADALLARFGRTVSGHRAPALELLGRDLAKALELQAELATLMARMPQETQSQALTKGKAIAFLQDLAIDGEDAFAALWAQRQAWAAPHGAYQDKLRSIQATTFHHPGVQPLLAPFLDRQAASLAHRKDSLAQARASVEAALQATLERLAVLDLIQEQLPDKKARLASFLTGGALAAALKTEEERCGALEAQRLALLERRALGLILSRQKRLVEEKERPAVIQRASELFHTFTNRYDLTYADGAFLAQDGPSRLRLEALSDGTRVQLLLAVRLAFVELNESVQLPIFLDEILANADDERADAIIRTVLKIAETGRQVFYCTAQRDELARWQQLGGEAINPPIHLAVVRNLALAEHFPLPEHGWTPPEAPDPTGLALPEYVRALPGAVGPSIWTPLDPQHAYHALAPFEADLMAELVRQRVTTLGNLKRLAAGRKTEPWPAIQATLQVLATAQALLQGNRPRRLTPDVITAIDVRGFGEVLKAKFKALVAESGKDLETLFQEGLPKAFGAREEALREWFEANGYLMPEALTGEEIMIDLRTRFRDVLPEDSARWQVVERFVFEARA